MLQVFYRKKKKKLLFQCYLTGLLGMVEGVSAGVPMCLIPFYGDQFINAAAAENRGIAVVLEWEGINAKILKTALDKIFNDTR